MRGSRTETLEAGVADDVVSSFFVINKHRIYSINLMRGIKTVT